MSDVVGVVNVCSAGSVVIQIHPWEVAVEVTSARCSLLIVCVYVDNAFHTTRPCSPTAEDRAAAEAAALAATEGRKATARAALAALVADNSAQAAKDGMAMLRMLVANLVNQPNVPRYRRIATRYVSTPPLPRACRKRGTELLVPTKNMHGRNRLLGFRRWTFRQVSSPLAFSPYLVSPAAIPLPAMASVSHVVVEQVCC